MFPEKSSTRGKTESASVSVKGSDKEVDVKVVFLSELGICLCKCVCVCVCLCVWQAAGVASITSSQPHPPVQGIAQLPLPSNPFAVSTLTPHSQATRLLFSQPIKNKKLYYFSLISLWDINSIFSNINVIH